jgi:hypothetical protein
MSDNKTTPAKLGLVEDAASDDPFDLARLRITPDYLESTNVKKLLTTVPIRRPGPQDFFRVHPSPKYRETLAFVEIKDDNEVYIADLGAVPELQTECFIATLFTGITRTGVLFTWPVRVPAVDGRTNDWHTSAAVAAQHAMTSWVRMKANMSLRAYEIFEAESTIPDPQWPELTFGEIYRIAFKDRLINDPDHPAIKRLRGG